VTAGILIEWASKKEREKPSHFKKKREKGIKITKIITREKKKSNPGFFFLFCWL
jgi:hypothetical protein